MGVTPSQFDVLAKLLDVASLRHRVIAQNVANVNTPEYQRLDVAFEEELARRLTTEGADFNDLTAQVVEEGGGRQRADGNNVDIDAEMGGLTKNTLLYQTYTQLLASKLATMRAAITGRG